MKQLINPARHVSFFNSIRGFFLAIEITLFPWINFNEYLSGAFLTFLTLNVGFSVLDAYRAQRLSRMTLIDLLIGCLVLISVLNPGSYWMATSSSSPWVRMIIFYLRYLTFPRDFLKENADVLFKLILFSSIAVLYLWFFMELPENSYRLYAPYGDPNYLGFIFGSYAILSICYLLSNKGSKIHWAVIILCCLIVILTASRGTLIALSLTLGFVVLKSVRGTFVILVASLVLYVGLNSSGLLPDLYIIERLISPRSSDIGAANSRLIEIQAAVNNFSTEIWSTLFGNGLSSSDYNLEGSQYRIHNSLFAIMYDSPLFMVISNSPC